MKFIFVVLARSILYSLETYCFDSFYTQLQHNHNHNISIINVYSITNTAEHVSKKCSIPNYF